MAYTPNPVLTNVGGKIAQIENYRFLGVAGSVTVKGIFVDLIGNQTGVSVSTTITIGDASHDPQKLAATIPSDAAGFRGTSSAALYQCFCPDSDATTIADFKANYANYEVVPASSPFLKGSLSLNESANSSVAGAGGATAAGQAAEAALIGAVTETAPATDTASSGLNGRLQRIAQRITSTLTTLGLIQNANDAQKILYNGVSYTILHANIIASSNGDNTIVAADATHQITVVGYDMMATTAVTAQWQDGAGGTALSGAYPIGANGGISKDIGKELMQGTVNTLLNLRLGSGVAVAGRVHYILV